MNGIFWRSLFFGEVKFGESHQAISKLVGVKLGAANDSSEFQTSVAQGRVDAPGHELDGQTKRIISAGMRNEWGSLVSYFEYAVSTLNDEEEARTRAGYITLGYYLGDTLPHVTYAGFDQKSGWGQKSVAVGVKHMLNPTTALKLEWQRISPQDNPEPGAEMAAGLFAEDPGKERVNAFSFAIDVVF